MRTVAKKVCLLGDFAVGKTSLVRRFVDNQFSDAYLSTIGVKISRKLIHISTEHSLQLIIWDLEGRSPKHGVVDSYLHGASGAIVVCDVTRPETIEHLEEHIAAFRTVNPGSTIAVALNKSDLTNESTLAKPLLLKSREQIINIESTSAKDSTGVLSIFESIGKSFAGT